MKSTVISKDEVWKILRQVKDPEVPVLDIAELGVLRDVSFDNDKFLISITPTYSGCPAMHAIEQEIKGKLEEYNIENYTIKTIFSPAWTTDWMSDEAKQKLKDYGIAPPSESSDTLLKSILKRKGKPVQCPFCNDTDTKLTSAFGSTACKALHFCNHCHQPFEEFKCH